MTSAQATEYLLCGECEQRFGDVENRVSKITYQGDGAAPFLDLVGNALCASDGDEGVRFALPGRLPLDDLAYFGASVVWRASVASDPEINCSLAEHEESFRRYLFGEIEFPETAACLVQFHDLSLVDDMCLAQIFTMPVTTRNTGHDNHRFTLFGLQYIISSGDQLPPEARRRCVLRGEANMVALAPQSHLVHWLGGSIVDKRAVGKLAKALSDK